MLENLDFNSAKRFVAFLVGVAVLALNKKLSLDLDTASQATLAAFITGYIGQSAWKEVKTSAGVSASVQPPPADDKAAASAIAKVP